MAPPSSPPPPPDFAARELPVETIPTGTRLSRIHRSDLAPLHFGSSGHSRFDDQKGGYGICYLAMSPEGAFAETCVRVAGNRFLDLRFVQARSFSEIEVISSLRLASLHGPGLARMGATSAVSSGPYASARFWSQAVHDHPSNPDGIAYRSRHDDDEICIALFDRADDSIATVGAPRPMQADLPILLDLCWLYGLGLE